MLFKKYLPTNLLLIGLVFITPIEAQANDKNELKRKTPLEKALRHLSTYQELQQKLNKIAQYSKHPISIGPLIENYDNNGLINIDGNLPLSLNINYTICDKSLTEPSIREAVICTINDGGRGNTDSSKIGKSTQGRDLLAVRMGNTNGTKVMIITQQHGNEVASTEAALKVIKRLSKAKRRKLKNVLEKLDLLILVRANPDGGEPDINNCATDPQTGTVITENCALIRHNVDPSAGGGFLSNSEVDFAGVVGRGYDLNRYHHVDLNHPIRPVETQAIVAAALAFQPDVVIDLHGDLHKSDCTIDYSSINPGQVLGQLPTANCITPELKSDARLLSPFADAQPGSEQEFLVQSLSASVMRKIDRRFRGSVGRFSQIQSGGGNISSGVTSAYQLIGAGATGWETVNFDVEMRADVIAIVNGQPVIGFITGLPDPALLKKQIKINRVALMHALKTLAYYHDQTPTNGSNFCDFPLASGLIANLPPKYWGDSATEGTVMVPMSPEIGLPLYISGNCPDNPVN
ncbi:MAG: hypothetical protein HRT53_12880 [Colwellia sp.]|nr:hypothetical protein [Colwellia sp.]